MRNVFLCFLTVLFVAPNAVPALAATRSVMRNESGAENTRTVATGRSGATRSIQNSNSGATSRGARTEKTVSRNGDTVARVAKRSDNITGRTVNNTSVVSRTKEKTHANNVLKSRTQKTAPLATPVPHDYDGKRLDLSERNIASRAAQKQKNVTAQDVANAKELLEQTASLNKSCQDQYNECMDQFCAVVDANQKRCSCSANLAKYTNVQDSVNKANDELNQVAQRIRYVGLSADEIRAIMTETQAEAELDNTKDKSETRSMLDKIEELIQDPTSKTTSYEEDNFGLNLDIDFSDNSADIFNLDFLNTGNDSISSKRGTALYNAAKKRCQTVLNNCTNVGATSSQITGNYELAIDKDCIAYEQGLKKMNQTLQSNVRSAGLMLQKARLAVLQNKNQFDAKGCIGALETCMTDEMVCGENYVKCLDPTKRYIDENGQVVLGQDITNITDFIEGFNAAEINNLKLSSAASININESTCKTSPNNDGTCVIKYLLNKIGTGATVKDGGLCRAVLDKCQQHTYNKAGAKYEPYNDVVVGYVQRAMVNIKSAQQQIISEYASTCMTDVAECYNQQVTQVNSWSSSASVSSIKGVMTGACRNVALTCAYAVFDKMCTTGTTNAMNWVLQSNATSNNGTVTASNNTPCTPCDSNNQDKCIEGISEIFYQSLLCPENSTYDISSTTTSPNRTIQGNVNTQCKCNSGYSVWNGSCLPLCATTDYRNEYGTCTECSGTLSGGSSTMEASSCTTVTQSNNTSQGSQQGNTNSSQYSNTSTNTTGSGNSNSNNGTNTSANTSGNSTGGGANGATTTTTTTTGGANGSGASAATPNP